MPIPAFLRDALDEHLLRTGRSGDDLIFGRSARDPFVPSTVRPRALVAWKESGLDPITLHECRHTFASLMIAAGVNAKALSAYMGHASIEITYDRYGHLMPGNEVEAGRTPRSVSARRRGGGGPLGGGERCATRAPVGCSRERLAAVRRRGRSGDLGTNPPQ